MKKTILLILGLVLIAVSIIYVKYMNYRNEQNKIKEYNLEYEVYLNEQILGTELTTVINKAVDNNTKNKVPKDENGFYIQNDINSVKIDIKITDNDTTYNMETLYNGGMVAFVQNYNLIYFECTKIEYNNVGRVKYMIFEQKTS